MLPKMCFVNSLVCSLGSVHWCPFHCKAPGNTISSGLFLASLHLPWRALEEEPQAAASVLGVLESVLFCLAGSFSCVGRCQGHILLEA